MSEPSGPSGFSLISENKKPVSPMNLQRLSISIGRKSLIPFFDILNKRSQSTSVTICKTSDDSHFMQTAGFQFLSHQSYYPLMIETITKQLDIIDKFVTMMEHMADVRQSYSTALKEICTNFSEGSDNVNDTQSDDTNGIFHDIWEKFIEKVGNEAELQENVVQQTKTKVIVPLQWIVKHRRQQISRLKSFRTSTDSTLRECSERVIELHGNYSELYKVHREILQTKAIKDLLNAHNSYVLQLHMTNTMKEYYHNLILPQIMQEFETIIKENTAEFREIFDYFGSLHENMFDHLMCNIHDFQSKVKEISPDAIVAITVQNMSKRQSPLHWQLTEYLPPDCDCPEILCSDNIIVDSLVKVELQTKFSELKRQFAELSSFMQQNVDVVNTLKTLEKRIDLHRHAVHTNLKLQDDIYRKEDEIRKARIALAGIEIQLKIIGMKKESSGDLKSTASSGPQNIKGLWKRAFQSLRKDKNEKDQYKRKENGSQGGEAQTPEGEIDPVYHLLRCAASKSQSTALATTGLTNAKTNLKPKSTNPDTSQTNSGDSGQSSRLDNYEVNPYTGSMILRKTSPIVSFKQNESERCRLDEYLLDNNNNNNNNNTNNVTLITNTNNNNQINAYNQNTESENNSSRFNENQSTKNNNVLIPTNVKLIPPNPISEQQQIINLNEAELAYEQHKRMNPRQKAPRSGQKSPSFLVEEDQQSYVIDYDQEVEQKSSRSTYEIKSYKPFTGNNPKSFPSAQRPTNERMYTLNRMKMMSMEENEDDEPNTVDDVQKFQKINHNVNYFRTEHTGSSSSHKYAQNFSSQSNKQNNYDDVVPSIQQITNVEDRTRKNPLLSTKSFSLDVPRFDQPNESSIGGSGGSSPGRYSEGPRKSSVAKYPQCLSSRMSPSLFSARMTA
uniref:F-BAR domain-containing protein n=1 Tax=Trichobilharzia regenti TaxID=157069 RepID=A0AA85JUE7_TRIRE|nr:unnamed protein product [Trichobilharzia regenti]